MRKNALLLFIVLALPLAARAETYTIQKSSYTVRSNAGNYPFLEILREGQLLFRLPLISGLSTPGQEERLSNIRIESGGTDRWQVTADSSIWRERKFFWKFIDDHIEFQQFASGPKPIERCYFFSNGISERWTNGTSPGVFANSTI